MVCPVAQTSMLESRNERGASSTRLYISYQKRIKLKTRFPSYPVARFVYQMANSWYLLIDLIDSFQQQKKSISRVR